MKSFKQIIEHDLEETFGKGPGLRGTPKARKFGVGDTLVDLKAHHQRLKKEQDFADSDHAGELLKKFGHVIDFIEKHFSHKK